MKLSYEDWMRVKNVLIYFSGSLSGILFLSLLSAYALTKFRTSKTNANMDVTAVKLKDKNGQQHLMINITSFPQAFHYLFTLIVMALIPKKRLHYKNRAKEVTFFVVFTIIVIIFLIYGLIGIIDITTADDANKLNGIFGK